MSSSGTNSPARRAIRVQHVTPKLANGRTSSHPARPWTTTRIEQDMDDEVGRVLQDIDDNVRTSTTSSFHVRPSSSTGSEKRFQRRTFGSKSSLGSPAPTRVEFPEIDISQREDNVFDASADSVDQDNSRWQQYSECPDTGLKVFRMEFDVAGYDAKNIEVKVSGSRLIVHAVQKRNDRGKKSSTEFCRKVKIPQDVDAQNLQCDVADGMLVVTAPLLSTASKQTLNSSIPGTPNSFSIPSPKLEPLNTPMFRTNLTGRQLNLFVEVGKVFKADDVVVKVKSHDKLIVHAERHEASDRSRLVASLDREFDLKEHIIPQSLKAGLTTDGVLKISADAAMATAVRVMTNGFVNGNHGNGNQDTSGLGDSESDGTVTG